MIASQHLCCYSFLTFSKHQSFSVHTQVKVGGHTLRTPRELGEARSYKFISGRLREYVLSGSLGDIEEAEPAIMIPIGGLCIPEVT